MLCSAANWDLGFEDPNVLVTKVLIQVAMAELTRFTARAYE